MHARQWFIGCRRRARPRNTSGNTRTERANSVRRTKLVIIYAQVTK